MKQTKTTVYLQEAEMNQTDGNLKHEADDKTLNDTNGNLLSSDHTHTVAISNVMSQCVHKRDGSWQEVAVRCVFLCVFCAAVCVWSDNRNLVSVVFIRTAFSFICVHWPETLRRLTLQELHLTFYWLITKITERAWFKDLSKLWKPKSLQKDSFPYLIIKKTPHTNRENFRAIKRQHS